MELGIVIFFLGNLMLVLFFIILFYVLNYVRFIVCNDIWWVFKVWICVFLYSRGVGYGFLEYL